MILIVEKRVKAVQCKNKKELNALRKQLEEREAEFKAVEMTLCKEETTIRQKLRDLNLLFNKTLEREEADRKAKEMAQVAKKTQEIDKTTAKKAQEIAKTAKKAQDVNKASQSSKQGAKKTLGIYQINKTATKLAPIEDPPFKSWSRSKTQMVRKKCKYYSSNPKSIQGN